MKSAANVRIHASQFPENVRRDLLASLRTRKINHKFHYDSVKQTQKWLALHQIYSPSRNDADCAATYDRAFAEAAGTIKSKRVHVIGLGCGGGQKDTRLLKLLKVGRQRNFLHAVRCQHRDGSGRAASGAGGCAGEKLFSIRLRFGDGRKFVRSLFAKAARRKARHLSLSLA